MTVSRSELARRVAEETGLSRRMAVKIINSFIEEMADSLLRGERIELRNFGIFSKRELGERIMRNPQSGNKMRAPAKTTVKFKPGKRFNNVSLGEKKS